MEELITFILGICFYIWLGKWIYKKIKERKAKIEAVEKKRYEMYRDFSIHRENGRVYVDVSNLNAQKHKENETTEIQPFKMAFSILSKSEMKFYKVLDEVVNNQLYLICPKIRMQDILWINEYQPNKIKYLNKVNRKHIDFVICKKENMQPLFAIELDDKSHETLKRYERDLYVDNLFDSLKFPIIHITQKENYDLLEIKENLNKYMI